MRNEEKGGRFLQKIPKKEAGLRRRSLCFILALVLVLSTLSVGLSAVAAASDEDIAESGGNYLGETTDIDISAKAPSGGQSSQAYWVDATYYDYYSDEEMQGEKWLEPLKAGTGYDDAEDDWYTFETFNSKISSYASNAGTRMTYPLYFGNFCNTVTQEGEGAGAYINNAYKFKIDSKDGKKVTSIVENHGGPYARVINGLYNYQYFIDNSNGLNDLHDSIIGLAHNNLDANGNIRDVSGTKMPYFDASWLRQNNAGKSIKSHFPFRVDPNNTTGVITYSFDSNSAKDNVFFNWSGKTPQSVGYGQGAGYGVKDGLHDFMGTDSGYGIFPFNRSSGSNGGNGNLDYGFGIKLNMDFRVPENGTVDGTAGGSPVTFEYAGDDDLWVYLSEYNDSGELTNSRLILDLGGNHKEAKGKVDFKQMKSYITTGAAYANSNVKYKSDTMYIAKSDGWNDVNVWAWDDGLEGIWVNHTTVDIDGQQLYAFKLSDFGGRTKFTTVEYEGNWSSKRARDSQSGLELDCVLHSQLGNVCWSDNPNWIEPKYPTDGRYLDLAGVSYANDTQKVKSLGSQLDPDKTYHLTIFYMERGMIESNCMMKFTMTPVKNSLKVKKNIETEGLNTGIAPAVQGMDVSFTNKVNNKDEDTYPLTNEGINEFTSYDTGSSVSVREDKANKGVIWETTGWKIIDNNQNGKVLKQGSYTYDPDGTAGYSLTTQTDAFDLEDPRIATNTASLQVNFVNEPLVGGPLEILKTVKGDSSSTDTFDFEFLVDINGGTNYQGYNLKYSKVTGSTVTQNAGTMNSGKFSVKANEKIIIEGLPAGVTYILKETTKDGYQPISDFTGTVDTHKKTINVENVMLSGTGTLSVTKKLSSAGEEHTYSGGNLFSFKAEGMDIVQGKSTISTLGQSQETRTADQNGKVTFSANASDASDKFLKFNKVGKYAYKITETQSTASDISRDTKTIYALIDVGQGAGGSLKVNSTTYYSNASLTTPANEAVFINTVQTGSVKVVKYDNNPNNPNTGASALGGAYFNVYKVSADGADISTGTPVGESKQTNASGIAEFKNLDIYDFSTMERQWYALTETQGINGRIKDDRVIYFTLPMQGDGGEQKYDITYEYVNGAIKNPVTAGWGYGVLPTLGWAALILALAVAGFWILSGRKNLFHSPAHMRR